MKIAALVWLAGVTFVATGALAASDAFAAPAAPDAPQSGTHGERAPAPDPMKRFAWRDEAAGYTFVAPPRWAGKVKAVPMDSAALAASGATSGVRFIAGSNTVLALLSAADDRATALTRSGARELSRHDGHVVSVKAAADSGALALSDQELTEAIQWDDATPGAVSR